MAAGKRASGCGSMPHRIAAGGTSAGAVTSLLLATGPSDRSTAIGAAVSISGSLPGGRFMRADAPTLFFHGTADKTVKYEGPGRRPPTGWPRPAYRSCSRRSRAPAMCHGSTAAASSRSARISCTTGWGSTAEGWELGLAGRGLGPGLPVQLRRRLAGQRGRTRRPARPPAAGVEVAGAQRAASALQPLGQLVEVSHGPALILARLAQDAREDAVDEARRVGAAERLGGLDRLVDRALGRDRLLARDRRRGAASRASRCAGSPAPAGRCGPAPSPSRGGRSPRRARPGSPASRARARA